MATLTVQNASLDGLEPTYAAADAAGDEFSGQETGLAVTARVLLHVKNGDASPHTVTVASQVDTPPAGTAAADKVVSIPAGEERIIGRFPAGLVDADGLVHVTYDAVTSVTVAAIRV